MWAWRTEYGVTKEWSTWVGTAALAQGADGLYPLITGGTAAMVTG